MESAPAQWWSLAGRGQSHLCFLTEDWDWEPFAGERQEVGCLGAGGRGQGAGPLFPAGWEEEEPKRKGGEGEGAGIS